MKFGRTLAIIVHYMVQFNYIKKIIIRLFKVKLQKFQTYNPYEIWWTTCYHSPLYSAIQFGVLHMFEIFVISLLRRLMIFYIKI